MVSKIFLCVYVQSCLTLRGPMDCSPLGSPIHGILWARILERVTVSFFRGLPNTGIKIWPPESPALADDSLPLMLPVGSNYEKSWNVVSAYYVHGAELCLFSYALIPHKSSVQLGMWRRRWHPTPVLLPGKSHGRRSPVGCSPWGREESDTTERLHFRFSLSCIGEGNGNPLQCSCLENPMDGVAQSQTRLKWLSSSSSRNVEFMNMEKNSIESKAICPESGGCWIAGLELDLKL